MHGPSLVVRITDIIYIYIYIHIHIYIQTYILCTLQIYIYRHTMVCAKGKAVFRHARVSPPPSPPLPSWARTMRAMAPACWAKNTCREREIGLEREIG